MSTPPDPDAPVDPADQARPAGSSLGPEARRGYQRHVVLRLCPPRFVELDPDNHHRAVTALARLLAQHLHDTEHPHDTEHHPR